MAPQALLRLDPMARNHPAFSPTCAAVLLGALRPRARTNRRFHRGFTRSGAPARNSGPPRPVGCMRGSDGAPRREAANIGRQFRELGLIEIVAATLQNPHSGVRESTPIALQMLDWELGIVPAVVQINRR